jgi:hypothetical protein
MLNENHSYRRTCERLGSRDCRSGLAAPQRDSAGLGDPGALATGAGLLSLIVAGFLLALGGQLMLARRPYELATESLRQARIDLALQEPLEALSVLVEWPDPFRIIPEICVLRLTATTSAGRAVVSEIPRSRVSLSIPVTAPGAAGGGSREYTLAWQSFIEGSTSADSRAVIARIGTLNDWRLFDHLGVDIVVRSEKSVPRR